MSHIRNTPEFRLARSDSKDPATTCHGLTGDGRPCRRTVASKISSASKAHKNSRVPTELFCWQHQNQAADVSSTTTQTASRLKDKSSLDTLVERTGLLSLTEEESQKTDSKARRHRHKDKETRLHPPVIAERPYSAPEGRVGLGASSSSKPKKKSSFRRLVCFIGHLNDDECPEIHIRRRSNYIRVSSSTEPRVAITPPGYQTQGRGNSDRQRQSRADSTLKLPSRHSTQTPQRPGLRPLTSPNTLRQALSDTPSSKSSQTQSLLSWIPSDLSPETTSKLLQKLAEPLSNAEEPGYIYIYCVTSTNSTPSPEATSSLIPPPSSGRSRRTSDVLRSAGIPASKSRDRTGEHTKDTITLKIGRAVNVSRRLTQHQQCAQNLTLVRYYPYSPSTADALPPKKAPNVHRLERLIHIELEDRRFKLVDPCEHCGKRHQEFFEIEADKEQLRLVDECVRRWVRYSEQNPFS